MNTEKVINWEPLASAGAIVVTILGVVLPLFVHLDNKTELRLAKSDQQIEAIRLDIKDFHGRLCAIEERRK
jgi:hypothetical protein